MDNNIDFENEQRVHDILLKNTAFISRYERMKVLRKNGDNTEPLIGISDDEALALAKTVKEQHGFDMPGDYITFLKLTDGFSCFDSDDSQRELHGEDYLRTKMTKLMYGYVVGDYDDWGVPCYYQYSTAKKRFFSYDYGGGNLMCVFDTFLDMLDHMLDLEVRDGGLLDEENYDLIRDDIDQNSGPDTEKPLSWYINEAENGCADAQFELARIYENDDVVDEDLEKAVFWYTKSAEQGHADAQFYLGCLYFSGDIDDPDDYVKAIHWVGEAADQGHREALDWLAELHAGDGYGDAWD